MKRLYKKIPIKKPWRTNVLVLEPTWQCTNTCDSQSRGCSALFWLLCALHACDADILVSKAPTCIHGK